MIEKRIAAAERAAQQAEAAYLAARKANSAELLATLLTEPRKAREAALAKGGSAIGGLVAADRRRLMRSLRKSDKAERQIVGGFASSLEMWRSRLRYKLLPAVVSVLALIAIVVLGAVAYSHTPIDEVIVVGPMDWKVDIRHANGTLTRETIKPGAESYGVMKYDGNLAVIRRWVDNEGYETFSLPIDTLEKPAKPPKPPA